MGAGIHADNGERLRHLGAHLAVFDSLGFEFGRWVQPAGSDDGVIEFPHYELEAAAAALVRTANELDFVYSFDWQTWKETAEAATLRDDPSALARASGGQLAKLLTTLIRGERFMEGSLAAAYDAGLLTGILRRADVLGHQSTAGHTIAKAEGPG